MRPNRTQPVSFPTVMTITAQPRTYQVVTYGCQMNVHDSERIAGLLESAGYTPMDEGQQADVVVFNTCAVREKPAIPACKSPSAAAWPRRTAT